MKTKNFFKNETKALAAFMTAAVMTMSFTACSQDNDILESAVTNPELEITRSNGIEPVTYVERSWDGSKVVSTARAICDYTELSGSDKEGFRCLESGKWYVVKTSFECKSIYAPKGRPAHLIICDGATLTARIDIDKDNALHIYGQQNDSGKLIAKGFTWISQKDDDGVIQDVTNLPGIGSRLNMGKLVIHGGNISASCSEATHSAGIGGGDNGDGGDFC